MKDFIFSRNHFILDLLLSVPFGTYLGYWSWLSADSEGHHPEGLYRAALVGAASFLTAFLLSFFFQYKFRLFPSFLLIVILGPLFFGISYRGMIYLDWLEYTPFSMGGVAEQGKYALGLAVFIAIPFLICVLLIRVFAFLAMTLIRQLRADPKLR